MLISYPQDHPLGVLGCIDGELGPTKDVITDWFLEGPAQSLWNWEEEILGTELILKQVVHRITERAQSVGIAKIELSEVLCHTFGKTHDSLGRDIEKLFVACSDSRSLHEITQILGFSTPLNPGVCGKCVCHALTKKAIQETMWVSAENHVIAREGVQDVGLVNDQLKGLKEDALSGSLRPHKHRQIPKVDLGIGDRAEMLHDEAISIGSHRSPS